jgi:Chaperone of endosialidase
LPGADRGGPLPRSASSVQVRDICRGNGQFSIDAPGAPGGRLVVTNGGSVGIGKSSPNPAYGLHLGPDKALRIDGGNEPADQGTYVSLGTGAFMIDMPGMAPGEWTPGGRFIVTNQGSVGINTPNGPQARLEVNGDVLISGDRNLFVTGHIVWKDPWVSAHPSQNPNDWPGKTGWMYLQDDNNSSNHRSLGDYAWTGFVPSDSRLKIGVRPVGHALEMVRKLRGVRFRWGEAGLSHFTRDIEKRVCAGPGATEEENCQVVAAERRRALDALTGGRIGLVAQDVEAVLPELVREDRDGYKHISYQHLTAVLIEAIKEQDAAVRALSARVAALQAGQPGRGL